MSGLMYARFRLPCAVQWLNKNKVRITTRTEENWSIFLYIRALLNEIEATDMVKLPPLLGRILCWLGFHDYRVVSVTLGFGTGGVERDECRRCGATVTRNV